MGGHKSAQSLRVFIVHGCGLVAAKEALLLLEGLGWGVIRGAHSINLKLKT